SPTTAPSTRSPAPGRCCGRSPRRRLSATRSTGARSTGRRRPSTSDGMQRRPVMDVKAARGAIAAAILGAGCGGPSGPPVIRSAACDDPAAPVVITDQTNYTLSNDFMIEVSLLKDNTDLVFDWSQVTRDFFGKTLDAAADIDIFLVSLWALTPEQLRAAL